MGDAVCGQPAGIFQVDRRRAAGKAVEIVHVPIGTDVLSALQLLDDLTHGELTGDATPGFIVGIASVQSHEGIRMPQHPAQGMHGAGLIAHPSGAAIAGIGDEGVHVHQHIGTFGALAGAGTLAGTGEIMLQTEDGKALQVMRGGIDQAMRGGLGQLRIGTVFA